MPVYFFYTMLRLLIFLVVALVLYLVGARSFMLVLLAVLISAGLSYVLLRGPRDRVATQLQNRMEHRQQSKFARRIDADNEAEDAAADGR